MCIAALAIVMACGEKKAQSTTDNEKAEINLSAMTGKEQCEATWLKRYDGKLKLADVQPDFEFTEQEEGKDCFSGNGVNKGKAVFLKKNNTDITPDEWNAYITKIYNLTKKLAQDGKVVRGFGSDLTVKTREQALEEKSLDAFLDGDDHQEWAFLKNDRFEACYLNMKNLDSMKYVSVVFVEGIQRNLDEAINDVKRHMKKY